MSDVMIQAEALGKRYRLGGQQPYKALRDSLTEVAAAPWRALRTRLGGQHRLSPAKPGEDDFWALRDLTFEICRGEVVGLVGRNGAGKSTLLKILSRITEPTTGRAEIRGRVGSLLEVGTGFHPELTGRENVYLNGAILGMTRREISRRFDEIVAFAEVARFVDTPVKYYSSGMYVRLAFAVAAHLEPEILLVDEVLSVGDIEFQKKCTDRMESVAGSGRTVVFVSHNLPMVRWLCSRAIWLDRGRIVQMGDCSDVVGAYETQARAAAAGAAACGAVEREPTELAGREFGFRRVALTDVSDQPCRAFRSGERLRLWVDLHGAPATRGYNLEFRLHTAWNDFVGMGSSAFQGLLLDKRARRLCLELGPLPFTAGQYLISLSAVDSHANHRYDNWIECCSFEIIECAPFGFGHQLRQHEEGLCVLPHAIQAFTDADAPEVRAAGCDLNPNPP